MMYNISNIYYTTLFCDFQEELALFLQKEGTKKRKRKGGSENMETEFQKAVGKGIGEVMRDLLSIRKDSWICARWCPI